jgi:hypothetical protein
MEGQEGEQSSVFFLQRLQILRGEKLFEVHNITAQPLRRAIGRSGLDQASQRNHFRVGHEQTLPEVNSCKP